MNTNPPVSPADTRLFDVRSVPGRVKHQQIFQRWDELLVDDYFVLVNDHDPVPLFYQFSAQFPGCFSWEYLKADAEEFHVKITRLALSAKTSEVTRALRKTPVAPPSNADLVKESQPRMGETDTLDMRGLEPPEPMMRILNAASELTAGRELRAITDRRPIHLFAELEARGLKFENKNRLDGAWETLIRRI